MSSELKPFALTRKVNSLFLELIMQYFGNIRDAYDAIIKSPDAESIIEENKFKFYNLKGLLGNFAQAVSLVTIDFRLTEEEMKRTLERCLIPLTQPNDIFFQVIYHSIKKDIPEDIWQQNFSRMDDFQPNPIDPICEYTGEIIPRKVEVYTPNISIDPLIELFNSLTHDNLEEKIELAKGLIPYITPYVMFGEYDKGSSYIADLSKIDPNYIKNHKAPKARTIREKIKEYFYGRKSQ